MNMINISVAGGVPSPVEGACGALTIGNVGDNGATGVLLDFSAWSEEYGSGAVTLGVRRKGDAAWYPVALTVTGAEAVWIVSNIDTAVYGIGEARFAYTVGEVEKRSAVFRFFVDRGLGAPEGTPPEPYEDWVERLEDLGAETLQNAQDAAESASKAQGYAGDAETAKNDAEAAKEEAEDSQADAEAWAVGERGGEPVQPGDPTYHNNAKYWAEEAHTTAPVTSVNGKTGAVTLDAEDVGALPGSSTLDGIPDGATYKRATGAQLQQIGTNTADVQQLQDDVDAIEAVIPNQASAQNQLADKAFVNSSIQTSSAHFRGNWPTWADVPTDPALYPMDDDGNTTPTSNDYMVLQDASGYPAGDDELEGTWRFKFSGVWALVGRAGWHPEYQVNETPLTAAQLAALNSGATAALIAQITANETAIQGKQNKITASGILKGDGAGGVSVATPGTDYATPEQVNAKYTKPVGGIPASDMAQAVQTSLGLADTALQAVPNTYRTAAAQDVIDAGKINSPATAGTADQILGLDNQLTPTWQDRDRVVTVTGTTPTITARPGVRYVCGEITTLDIMLPTSGVVDVTFESGSTATVLTITPPTGQTVRWANGFDPTSLNANTTYEINIMDGLGVAASWS